MLGEARSSFYHASTPAATQVADVGLGDLIEAVFRRHRRRYGYRRLAEDLSDRGVTCAPARAERSETAAHSFLQISSGNPPPHGPERPARNPAKKLRPENQRRQSRQALAQSPLRPAPPCCSRPCLGWGHYLHPNERRMALPGRRHRSVLGRIVGWSLADHMRSDLVLDALHQALATRPTNRTIFHSDRGSQYGSIPFRKALTKAGLRQSMSARANPCDNAWSESFIGTLKHEMLQDGCFENAGEARTEIFEYIECYYNTHAARQSALVFREKICAARQDEPTNRQFSLPRRSLTPQMGVACMTARGNRNGARIVNAQVSTAKASRGD